jgi:hypothetical protein
MRNEFFCILLVVNIVYIYLLRVLLAPCSQVTGIYPVAGCTEICGRGKENSADKIFIQWTECIENELVGSMVYNS